MKIHEYQAKELLRGFGVAVPRGKVISDASGPVVIQILKGAEVIRTYSSANNPTGPNPDQNPEVYNQLCWQNPRLAHCDMTMYWPAARHLDPGRRAPHLDPARGASPR